MADVIWIYAELSEDKLTPTTLEMLTKAAEVGKAEAVLLGPAPDDTVPTLAKHGASKIYRSADSVYKDYLTLPAAETFTCADADPTAAVLESRESVAGRLAPKIQPPVTSVSKSELVTASGPLPGQIIWL